VRFLRALLSNGLFVGSASALIVQFSASVLGFVMFALAARQMQHAEFGSLAVIFNTMSLLAVVFVFGQETLISRSWQEYSGSGKSALGRGALTFGLCVSFLGALTVALLSVIGWVVFRDPPTIWLPLAASAFLFAQALMTFNARLSLVTVGIGVAEVPRSILWRSAVILAILFHITTGSDFTAVEFFSTAAAVLALSLLYQGWRIVRVLPESVKNAKPQFDLATWWQRSKRMWLSSCIDTNGQFLEVIIVAFFLGPVAAAFYFSATRITNVFAMIAGGITVYATSHISRLYHTSARDELQRILRSLALFSAILGGAAFVTIILAGKLLLSFFGPAYADYYPALVVLAFGASLTALAGPAPYLLLLTGQERIYPWIMGSGVVLKFALIGILGTWFGVLGAAAAASLSAGLTSIALVIACRRTTELDPSILSAVWRRGQGDPGRTAAALRQRA